MEEIEAFRYRARDAWRAVTRIAVREARIQEIKIEMMQSKQLKVVQNQHIYNDRTIDWTTNFFFSRISKTIPTTWLCYDTTKPFILSDFRLIWKTCPIILCRQLFAAWRAIKWDWPARREPLRQEDRMGRRTVAKRKLTWSAKTILCSVSSSKASRKRPRRNDRNLLLVFRVNKCIIPTLSKKNYIQLTQNKLWKKTHYT